MGQWTSYADASAVADADTLLIQQGGAVKEAARSLFATPAAAVLAVSTGGSDSTGSRGRLDRPYLTPTAAQAAAQSGDLIIVYPGTYSLTAALGKNGVNWHLLAGVRLQSAHGTNVQRGCFSDGGYTVPPTPGTAMTFRVTGRGWLEMAGDLSNDVYNGDQYPAVVNVTNSASDIRIECSRITVSGSDAGLVVAPWAINHNAGICYVTADVIECTGTFYTSVISWTNGELHVKAGVISGSASAAVSSPAISGSVTASPTGDAWITADRIVSADYYGVSQAGSQAQAKLWVNCPLIEGQGGAVACSNGKLYVNGADKIVDNAGSGSGNAVVSVSGGEAWVTTQKITGNFGSAIQTTGGTAHVAVQHIEDSGNLSQAIKTTAGTLELFGGRAVLSVGDGVNHSGGTTRLSGVRLDSSAAASKNPATVSGSGLILDRCTLVANAGRESVFAGSAKTITNYGSVANTAKNANVTVNVQALTVDSNVA